MSQVTITNTTTTPSMTAVCSRTTLITKMVMLAPTSVGQTTLGQPPQLILKDTVKGSVGLTTMQQQQP